MRQEIKRPKRRATAADVIWARNKKPVGSAKFSRGEAGIAQRPKPQSDVDVFFKQVYRAVIGDGDTNNAGLVFVENLADAIFLAATDERAIGQTYNVYYEEPITWGRYTDDLAKIAKKPPPPRLPLGPLMQIALENEDPAQMIGPKDTSLPTLEGLNLVGFDNRFNSSQVRNELGWRPRIPYADAIESMARQWTKAKQI